MANAKRIVYDGSRMYMTNVKRLYMADVKKLFMANVKIMCMTNIKRLYGECQTVYIIRMSRDFVCGHMSRDCIWQISRDCLWQMSKNCVW